MQVTFFLYEQILVIPAPTHSLRGAFGHTWTSNMGDPLHLIKFAQEKFGGQAKDFSNMAAFNNPLTSCDLRELGYKGINFTWHNERAELGTMHTTKTG